MTTPDLLDPEFYGDIDGMHESLRALRTAGPLWRDEKNGLWAVLSHAALCDVERRDEVFSSHGSYRSRLAPGERDMIALDDPEHNEQRRLVSKLFTPKAVQRFEPVLDRVVSELVDAIVEQGEFEVVDDLAAPLPAKLTAHLIGFPPEDWPSVRSWSERLMRIDTPTPEARAEFGAAIMEFAPRVMPISEERKADPRDDLISAWTHSELRGAPMDPQTMIQETGLFISGGAETTRTVIARGLVELTKHPDQWDALAADPSSIPSAVEELIRWVTPLNNFFRTAARDDQIAGTPVAAGDRVILLYPSANRDETVFEDPYAFDVRRNPNPHVAFGLGTHFCLGSSLARLELTVMLRHLTQRIASIEMRSPMDVEPNIFVGAVRSCRMAVTPR